MAYIKCNYKEAPAPYGYFVTLGLPEKGGFFKGMFVSKEEVIPTPLKGYNGLVKAVLLSTTKDHIAVGVKDALHHKVTSIYIPRDNLLEHQKTILTA
ncbi:MAG: hypothetical protein V1914_00220 [archaeon]